MAPHLTLDDVVYTGNPEADTINFDSLLRTLSESGVSNTEASYSRLGRFLESLGVGADVTFPVPGDATQPLELVSTPISSTLNRS